MKMLCRITDEQVNNPWEAMNDFNEPNHKDITLYDLCAEDHYVFAKLEKDGDVSIIVEDENDQEIYIDKGHICAWDSLVSFAKMVLAQDARIQMELEKDDYL